MKRLTYLCTAALLITCATSVAIRAEENHPPNLADATKEVKAKPYPLDFCLVSEEKFAGSQMKPFEMVHEGQTIKFCCKSCVKDFKKDTKKFLIKLDTEVKKQAAANPKKEKN